MDNAKKTCAYLAVLDVLELLNRTNKMIALHQSQDTQDTLAIAGYQRQREQFLRQLAELLVPLGVEIIYPSRII